MVEKRLLQKGAQQKETDAAHLLASRKEVLLPT